ncbi:MAG: OmpA family protein [Bacteroidia bacterium]|jgi:outer membrane protein OmpA-like peptidoglycan-associated protein|nr:OmpA family protein [Bacteroidia bacterium]
MNTVTLTLAALALGSLTALNAQNLVKNGSFEENKCEPKGWGEIGRASMASSANNTTVDYYGPKACKGQALSTGENFMGSQAAFEGQHYAGIIAYYGDEATDWSSIWSGELKTRSGYQNYSEYVQLEFSSALEAGKTYNISFQVSLADKSAFAVSGLGAYISKEKMNEMKNSYLSVEPHISSPSMADNMNGWTEIKGNYTAKGGEMYIVIGCFNKGMDKKSVLGQTNQLNMRRAYYYIDGVNVAAGAGTPVPTQPKDELYEQILSGANISLKGLNFETGSATIKKESYADLDKWVTVMQAHPELKIAIEGHTDASGNAASNMTLSKQRAESVKKYFISKGIAADRMTTEGFGSTRPIDKENVKSLTNRRVEIHIAK